MQENCVDNYKYVITDRWGYNEPLLFSSKEKLLDYLQKLHPDAKHLRIMEYENSLAVSVVNYTTHLSYGIRHTITKVKEDTL